MTAALALTLVHSCTKAGQDVSGGIVQKEVGISISDGLQTKTALYQYDTEAAEHPVSWTVGDRIWCYSQSGIYMDYTLKSTDLSGDFSGENSRTHIAYRYGDQWVVCYCKGSSIGDYVGARKKDLLVLGNGIPRVQTGKFADSHVCIVRTHPDEAEFGFENMQAFLRFEVTQSGDNRDGKLLEHFVTKITVESCKDGERMSGNLEIKDNGGWRTTLQDGGSDEFNTITVIPDGGHFIPSASDDDPSSYFVAVPARSYSKGLRFNLYTHDGVSEAARGYVEVPATTITRNQILNCHDLLKYCALYVDGISLTYGAATGVQSTGITMAVGHAGKLVAVIHPTTATDQSLEWSVSDGTVSDGSDGPVCTVAQDGTVTALKIGSCTVTCTAKDGSGVSQRVVVNVVDNNPLSPPSYDPSDYEGGY